MDYEKYLFVAELVNDSLSNDEVMVTLKHPMLCQDLLLGKNELLDIAAEIAQPLSHIAKINTFVNETMSAIYWNAQSDGREINGITIATTKSNGIEVSIVFRPFGATEKWRETQIQSNRLDLPLAAWLLPENVDTSIEIEVDEETFNARLPFELAPDVIFDSPVLSAPVTGADKVETVIKHAAAVYGMRNYGPKMMSATSLLSLWEVEVSGELLEVANIITLDDQKRVKSMLMFMRPWPAIELFRDRVKALSSNLQDQSFLDFS